MKNYLYRPLCLLALLLSGLFASSCENELLEGGSVPGGATGDGATVMFNLSVSGMDSDMDTRAVSDAEESKINDLHILAFQYEAGIPKLKYYARAKQGGGNNIWTAPLLPSDTPDLLQTFVLVANADGTSIPEQLQALCDPANADNKIGEQMSAVLPLVVENLTSAEISSGINADADDNHRPFTMYGKTNNRAVIPGNSFEFRVDMYRIMARINVVFDGTVPPDASTGGIGIGEGKFVPNSVRLYNYSDRVRVFPDNPAVTAPAPVIPAEVRVLPGKSSLDGTETVPTYTEIIQDGDKYSLNNNIYMFDTPTGTKDRRPCLIVGGFYLDSAVETFYRVDFVDLDNNFWEITRNKRYNIKITGVLTGGKKSAQEAFNGEAGNITATVSEWGKHNTITQIVTDGDNAIGITDLSYEYSMTGDSGSTAYNKRTTVQGIIASPNLVWKAELLESDKQTPSTWLRWLDTNTSVLTGIGNDEQSEYSFAVDGFLDGSPTNRQRHAVMRVSASSGGNNLELWADIVQNWTGNAFIRIVDAAGNDVEEFEFNMNGEETPEWNVVFGMAELDFQWSITARANQDPKIGRMDFDQTKFNGTVEADPVTGTKKVQVDGEDDTYTFQTTALTHQPGAGINGYSHNFGISESQLTVSVKPFLGTEDQRRSDAVIFRQVTPGFAFEHPEYHFMYNYPYEKSVNFIGSIDGTISFEGDDVGGDNDYLIAQNEGLIEASPQEGKTLPYTLYEWNNSVKIPTLPSQDLVYREKTFKVRVSPADVNKYPDPDQKISQTASVTIHQGFNYGGNLYDVKGPFFMSYQQIKDIEKDNIYDATEFPANMQALIADGYSLAGKSITSSIYNHFKDEEQYGDQVTAHGPSYLYAGPSHYNHFVDQTGKPLYDGMTAAGNPNTGVQVWIDHYVDLHLIGKEDSTNKSRYATGTFNWTTPGSLWGLHGRPGNWINSWRLTLFATDTSGAKPINTTYVNDVEWPYVAGSCYWYGNGAGRWLNLGIPDYRIQYPHLEYMYRLDLEKRFGNTHYTQTLMYADTRDVRMEPGPEGTGGRHYVKMTMWPAPKEGSVACYNFTITQGNRADTKEIFNKSYPVFLVKQKYPVPQP